MKATISIFTPRGGIFVLLLPVLLLLPVFHIHPGYEHQHGTHDVHPHALLVHADFLPVSAHDEGEHQHSHGEPDLPPSQSSSQINLFILPVRGFSFSPPVPEQSPVLLILEGPAVSSSSVFHAWVLARDHAPPVQNRVCPPSTPRSPPLFV